MRSLVARTLYSIAVLLLSVALLPLFMLKPRGRMRLLQRFGIWNLPENTYLWFHGASLGEINGLLPVIRALRKANPELPTLLTATSVTGIEKAVGEVDEARLLPIDSLWIYRLALGRSRIKALVITETEIWPGLIAAAKSRGARLCLVNGIVSDYSIRWYRLFRPFVEHLLKKFDSIFCASEISRTRFLELGAREEITTVTGNTKYDLHPSITSREEALAHKARFFSSDAPVLVLGSLRPGEELLWFPEIARCLHSGQALSVIVAPRHKEKFDFFALSLQEYSIPFRRWSEAPARPGNQSVVLLDTYGDLESAYSFADVAFVGGSIVDWGGHNPLEPACYGAFIAMGPHARNVKAIVADLMADDALVRVTEASDIRKLLDAMRDNVEALRRRGQGGQAVWQSHRGATTKVIDRVQSLLR